MYAVTETQAVTTSTGGDAVAYFGPINGPVWSVRNGSTTLASTGTIAVANVATGETIFSKALTSNTTWRPRALVCNSTGSTLINTTATLSKQTAPFEVGGGLVSVTITNAGSVKTANISVTHG